MLSNDAALQIEINFNKKKEVFIDVSLIIKCLGCFFLSNNNISRDTKRERKFKEKKTQTDNTETSVKARKGAQWTRNICDLKEIGWIPLSSGEL